MNKKRKISIIVGVLFLVALFANLVAEGIRADESLMYSVIILDLFSAIGVIGIGIFMYPMLRKYQKLAFSYAVLRILEGIIFFMMIMFLFFAINFSIDFNSIYVYVFVLGGLIFYSLLYRLKLIPNWLSICGVVAMIMLLIANIFGLLGEGSALMILLAFPIALQEFVLAIWLIAKGFR